MTEVINKTVLPNEIGSRPRAAVLNGQYIAPLRSPSGKIKGLLLKTDSGEYRIEVPKYLRPILVRQLLPDSYMQVHVLSDGHTWRCIDILPLPESETEAIERAFKASVSNSERSTQTSNSRTCIQVCTKGKCFKQGSLHLLRQLQEKVEANSELSHISIEGTGCMKACKQGPNLRVLPENQLVNRTCQSGILSALLEG